MFILAKTTGYWNFFYIDTFCSSMKKSNHLTINLTKDTEDHYVENYRMLQNVAETAKNINKELYHSNMGYYKTQYYKNIIYPHINL